MKIILNIMSQILNNEFFSYWIVMGNYASYELEHYKAPRIGYSRTAKTSDWDFYDTSKNYDYYFTNKRFTYISREHYKNDFEKGYIWGRYPIINPLDIIDEKEELERAF